MMIMKVPKAELAEWEIPIVCQAIPTQILKKKLANRGRNGIICYNLKHTNVPIPSN